MAVDIPPSTPRLTDAQIAAIVRRGTLQNMERNRMVQSVGSGSSPQSTGAPITGNSLGGNNSLGGMINKTAPRSRALTDQQKLTRAQDKATVNGIQKKPLDPNADMKNIIHNILRGIPLAGPGLDWLLSGAGQETGPIDDIFEPMGPSEKPQNLTQAVLNGLSTPLYMVAGAANEIGKNATKVGAKGQELAAKGDIAGLAGNYLQGSMDGVDQAFRGAARGFSEGMTGARYDGERPRTHGQNLEDMGVTDQLKNFVADRGGDEGQQALAAGILGFSADFVGDPLLYGGPLGIMKYASASSKAAGAAIRAGEPIAKATMFTGVKAGVAGRRNYLDNLHIEKAKRGEQRAYRRANKGLSGTDDAGRGIGPDAAGALADDVTQPPVIPNPVAMTTKQVDNAALRMEELVKSGIPITRARPVPAEQILKDGAARQKTAKPLTQMEWLDQAMATVDGPPIAKLPRSKGVPARSLTAQEVAAVLKDPETPLPVQQAIVTQMKQGYQEYLAAQAALPKTLLTPQSLTRAIEKHLPGASVDDVDGLVTKLAALPPAERPAALTAVLADVAGTENALAPTFGAAMQAALDGGVDAGTMRRLLNTMGDPTKATGQASLKSILSTRGVLRFQEIKASLRNRAEVEASHGIDEATSAEAAAIDVPAAEAAARIDNAEIDAERAAERLQKGYDPTQSRLEDAMLESGRKAAAEFGDPKNPGFVESYDFKAWNAVFTAAVKTDAVRHYLSKGRELGKYAPRAAAVFSRLKRAILTVENDARAVGRDPRLHLDGFDEPLHVSFSQLLDAIPDDLAKRMFFPDTALREGQKASSGFTVYPTTVGRGAYVAMKGGTPEQIYEAMKKGANAFESADTGDMALRTLAGHMAAPEFRKAISSLHEGQKIQALAKAHQVANAVSETLGKGIIGAAARGGDRSGLFNAIDDAEKMASSIEKTEGRSLIGDLVDSDLSNGVTETLGEAGLALKRFDKNQAQSSGAKTGWALLEQQHAAVAARNRARDAKGHQPRREAPTTSTKEERALRASNAQNLGKLTDDTDELITRNVQAEVEAGLRGGADDGSGTPPNGGLGDGLIDDIAEPIGSWIDEIMGLGMWANFGRFGTAFSGSWGMKDLKGLQQQFTGRSYLSSQAFTMDMDLWAFGRGTNHKGTRKIQPGLQKRLSTLTGAKISGADVNGYLQKWWAAVAQAETHLELTLMRVPTDDEVVELLAAGIPRSVELNMPNAVASLAGDELKMAMELRGYIHDIWAPVNGPLARSGVATSDLLREMHRRLGGSKGVLADYLPDARLPLGQQTSIWRSGDASLIEDPIQLLLTWQHALSAATVKPSMAASASKLLDHRSAMAAGKPLDQLIKEGWRRIDVENSSGLGPYLDPTSYFAPDTRKQFIYANHFFEEILRTPWPWLASLLRPYDATTNVLKSSNTIWNPSHHVTNFLGDNIMNLAAGVPPQELFRAYHAMRAGTKILDKGQMSPGDFYHASFAEAGSLATGNPVAGLHAGTGKLGAKYLGGEARILIRGADGKLSHVDLNAKEVSSGAGENGITVTRRESKDMQAVAISKSFDKFHAANRKNPLAWADHGLGSFSATRDNFTRLAQAYHVLEKGEYPSLEAAWSAATREVNRYHPTVQGLSATDQVVARRTIFFYTWVRQAGARIIEFAVERPAAVTFPSKAQYNHAEANGLEPDSFGKPHAPDNRVADFGSNSPLGPTWEAGTGPFKDPDYMPIDPDTGELMAPNKWGYNLSSPQMDALVTAFGGASWDDGDPGPLVGTLQQGAELLNPILKSAMEIATNSKIGGVGRPPAEDPNYLLQNLGVPYRLQGLYGGRLDPDLSPREAAGELQRQQLNYFGGLKMTNYTSPTSARVHAVEQRNWEIDYLEGLGYDPEEVKLIRDVWRKKRATQGVTP